MNTHAGAILFFVLVTICGTLTAQEPKDSKLFVALMAHDSVFFERSFNRCNIAYLEGAVDNEMSFYHDQSGIQDREKFLDNVKKYLCGDTLNKPIRKVHAQSLEVYPMYNNNVLYGAVQTGVHSFYRRQPNKPDVQTGTAKFIHLYLLKNDEWILKEVISFDHKEVK